LGPFISNVELRFLTEICGAEGPGGDMAAGELGLGGEAMMEFVRKLATVGYVRL
jgi:hypothetical protein